MQLAITVPIIRTITSEITINLDTNELKNNYRDEDITDLVNGSKIIAFFCFKEFIKVSDSCRLMDFAKCVDAIKIELLDDSNPHDLQQAMIP